MGEQRREPRRRSPRAAASKPLEGKPLAPGSGCGPAHLERLLPGLGPGKDVPSRSAASEVERFRSAVDQVRRHLAEHVRGFHAPGGADVEQVLAAHRMMLEDERFLERVEEAILSQGRSAESAVRSAFGEAASRLAGSDDPYLAARAEDLRDHCQLVVATLVQGEVAFRAPPEGAVLVLDHLHPSAALRARRIRAAALVTASEAATSHGAILLRAFGIPAVGGIESAVHIIESGRPVLVDGTAGTVWVDPPAEILARLRKPAREAVTGLDTPLPSPLDAISANGRSIVLWANVDDPARADLCCRGRLHGIGLLRTEVLMLGTGRVPDEEEQVLSYRSAVDAVRGRPIVFRTFDVGAGKLVDLFGDEAEPNPALGVRGLRRHLLRQPDELQTQLRAILRAGTGGSVSILVPMVTTVDDVRAARAHLDTALAQLAERAVAHDPRPRLGAMIEVPAAALVAEEILAEVDFICVGTNDLSQYLTAADRDNPAVADYLASGRPGLYRIVGWILDAARSLGRLDDVLVGGELPSDPRAARRLVELGCRALIVLPDAAAAVREAIAEAVASD